MKSLKPGETYIIEHRYSHVRCAAIYQETEIWHARRWCHIGSETAEPDEDDEWLVLARVHMEPYVRLEPSEYAIEKRIIL